MTPHLSFVLLAQLDALNPSTVVPVGKGSGLVWKDIVLIVSSGIALAVLLVLWAKYIRRKSRRRRHTSRRAAPEVAAPEAAEETEQEQEGEAEVEGHRRHRRHRRRLRRDHRQRNPTLAETGGLPPRRSEEPSASAPTER